MATLPKPLVPILNVGSFLVADLVMALPLAEGLGNQAADLSGNGHNATIAGLEGVDYQWVTDSEMGVVLELLTASAWLDLAASLLTAYAGQGSATLQCWLKLAADAPPVGEQGLCNLKGSGLAGTRTIYPDDPGGQNEIRSAVFRDATAPAFALDGGVDRSQWHLLTITSQNGGQYFVYQNGIQLSGVIAEPVVSLAGSLQFGRSDDTSPASDSLRGRIGDVRLWRRALQDYEVGSVFNNPWGLYTFFNPPGQIDQFSLSVDYQPRGASAASLVEAVGDFPRGQRVGMGDFDLLVDLNLDPGTGGAYDPPVAIRTDLSPFRKPALNGTPTPALNTDSIVTNLQLALLYNDPAGAADPLTEYANSLQASGINWTVAPQSDGQPDNDAAFALLSDQLNAVYATGNGGTIPDNVALKPTTNFTIAWYGALWGPNTANAVLVGKYNNTGATFAYALRIDADSDRLKFEMTDTIDGVATVISAANPTLGTGWNRVLLVGTYDGAIMRFYLNGVEVGNTINGGTVDHGTDPLGIGQDGLGALSPGGNAHSEAVFLWDRALDPDEVVKLSNSPFGMFCDSGYIELFGLSLDYQPRGAAALSQFDLLADLPRGQRVGCGEFDLLADLIPGVTNTAGLTFFSISPTIGPDQGGQFVTIKGRNFQDITQVLIGGTALQNLVVQDQGTIQGNTPVHIPGTVNVRIDSATRGFVEAELAYTFIGGFGPAVDQLIQGKQIDGSFWRQETFTGETAPQGVLTVLALTLADIPIHPEAVEVYVRRLDPGHGASDDGGLLMRQGTTFTYTVDAANRQIAWRTTAQIPLLPLDEVTVVYLARGEF